MTKTKLSRNQVSQPSARAAKSVWALLISLTIATAVAVPATAQTFTVLHEFAGAPNDGGNPRGHLLRDSAGNFFGTTFSGGGVGEGTIFKLSSSGHESVLFTFNTSNGSFPTSGLAVDKSGNLYGTADEGPCGAGVLFRLAKDGTEETFHAFQGGQDSEAAVPSGSVILDSAGNVYGTTLLGGLGFGTVYRVDPSGNLTVLYDFHGAADGSGPQGPLVRDVDGNVFGVAQQGGAHQAGTVFKLASNGTLTVLHNFTGGRDGKAPQGGLLRDGAGNLFGSAFSGGDTGNGTLFEITKAGGFRRLHSFSGALDGTNPNGELIGDSNGNIYGTTQLGGAQSLGTVFKRSRTGELTVLHVFTGDEDGATPFAGVIRDAAGNLYGSAEQNFLLQQRGGTIFKITP